MKRLALLLILIILLISGCAQKQTVFVTKIIDGDTFETSDGEIVRLLGINTPEKHEYYYEEAKEKLQDMIQGKSVTLESDQTDKDWYGRQLRYVYIGNMFVNSEMLEKGYARLYLLQDRKYGNILKYAEKHARDSHIGVWRYT